jgi:hypothetical protein
LKPQNLLELAPWGYLDSIVTKDGSLILGGWAAASRGRKIVNVTTKINVTKFDAKLGAQRQDVCDVLADPGFLNSGWHIYIPMDKVRKPVEIQIVAEADDGESMILYEGFISSS